MLRRFHVPLALLLLAGCGGEIECPEGSTLVGQRCIQDELRDMDVGDTADSDASLCETSQDCPEEQPICDDGACVGCREAAACAARDEATPHCSYATGACQACLRDVDCEEGVCAEGRCVECVPHNDAACEGKVCDALNQECTDHDHGSVERFEPCVADEQCPSDVGIGTYYCVPVESLGEPAGYRCLLDVGDDFVYLSAPFTAERTSLGGHRARYMTIHEDFVSWETAAPFFTEADESCTTDADCPAEGVCEASLRDGSLGCTFHCESDRDCRLFIAQEGHECYEPPSGEPYCREV